MFVSAPVVIVREDAFMFLPTMSGQWSLDNQNIPETETSLGVHTGSLPLSRFDGVCSPPPAHRFHPPPFLHGSGFHKKKQIPLSKNSYHFCCHIMPPLLLIMFSPGDGDYMTVSGKSRFFRKGNINNAVCYSWPCFLLQTLRIIDHLMENTEMGNT